MSAMSDFAITIDDNYHALRNVGLSDWAAAAITATRFGVSVQDVRIVVNDIMAAA